MHESGVASLNVPALTPQLTQFDTITEAPTTSRSAHIAPVTIIVSTSTPVVAPGTTMLKSNVVGL